MCILILYGVTILVVTACLLKIIKRLQDAVAQNEQMEEIQQNEMEEEEEVEEPQNDFELKEEMMENYLSRQMLNEEICEVTIENNYMIIKPIDNGGNVKVPVNILKTECYQLIREYANPDIQEVLLLDSDGCPILFLALQLQNNERKFITTFLTM